jgi:GNAT superfamily N-acetyltransferase
MFFDEHQQGKIKEILLKGYDLDTFQAVSSSGNACEFISLCAKSIYERLTESCEIMKSFHIERFDCFESKQNHGFGSIMLEQFISLVKSLKLELITGWISPVDIGNEIGEKDDKKKESRKRLFHFYRKHGFVISDAPVGKNIFLSVK